MADQSVENMNNASSTSTTTSGDSSSSDSSSSNNDKNYINKILGEMKSQFNKTDATLAQEDTLTSSPTLRQPDPTTTDSTNNNQGLKTSQVQSEEEEKPRIVLLFKKPSAETPAKTSGSNRRSSRHKPATTPHETVKRSTRRKSRDYSESVLQSAIARKEKSYNESNKPQRLTRQLKPTQKILENLELAKQEKVRSKLRNELDLESAELMGEEFHKRKHKHQNSKPKSKKVKSELKTENSNSGSPHESESDEEEAGGRRRSRRISASSRFKDDSNHTDDSFANDETSLYSEHEHSSSKNGAFHSSTQCLCLHKTQYILAVNDSEVTYCGAVDSIDSKLLGCNRTIDKSNAIMLRPSSRIPYTVFCEMHKNRLLRHNCCPNCGVFCTQGEFVECEAKHLYHRECQINVGNTGRCPHCSLPSPDHDITIKMVAANKPVILPVQKQQYNIAKMTFQPNAKSDDTKCITPPLLPFEAFEILNNVDFIEGDYEFSDLVEAIKANSIEKVAAILATKTVDITGKISDSQDGSCLHLAAERGLLPIVHILIISGLQVDSFDKEQNTPLMLAVLAQKNDVVKYLIRSGADVRLKGTDGMTALHLSAKCGNLEACELILDAAANVKHFVNAADDGGWTPLVWACEHGYEQCANYLIYKGADPTIRDVEHNVALHWAAFSGSSHIAELLLNKGCDVNAVNAHGDTPLHIGARQDMYNCLIVLLSRGADVTLLNKNNESALECVPPGGDSYNTILLNCTLRISTESLSKKVILCSDVSRGKELNPIQCYNNVDAELAPRDFKYITKSCISSDDVRIDAKISSVQFCKCDERCVQEDCSCGVLSVQCWYDEAGKLVPNFDFNNIPMIFECNDRCGCNAITCNNRVVQRGLSQRFELFRTQKKGWGVRTLRAIPKGSFVCEYVGEIVTDVEADRREDDSFMFELENRVCKNENEAYCIDARFYGNFTRFLNHSCDANLTPVKLFVEHQDLRFPRIAFFANKDIDADEELSFDYGEKFWIAKYKSMTCHCGSEECKYSELTIEGTLEMYQRKVQESA